MIEQDGGELGVFQTTHVSSAGMLCADGDVIEPTLDWRSKSGSLQCSNS